MTCDHSSSGEFGDVLEKETKSKRGVPGLSATGKAIPSRAPSSCYSPWRRVPQASWDESSMMHFTFQMSLPSGTNLTAASHVIFLHPMLAPTAEKAVGYEMQVPVEDMNLLNRCLAHRRSLCSPGHRPSPAPRAAAGHGARLAGSTSVLSSGPPCRQMPVSRRFVTADTVEQTITEEHQATRLQHKISTCMRVRHPCNKELVN